MDGNLVTKEGIPSLQVLHTLAPDELKAEVMDSSCVCHPSSTACCSPEEMSESYFFKFAAGCTSGTSEFMVMIVSC